MLSFGMIFVNAGRPMLVHVLDPVRKLGPQAVHVVVDLARAATAPVEAVGAVAQERVEPEVMVTLRPKHGIRMRLQPRHQRVASA